MPKQAGPTRGEQARQLALTHPPKAIPRDGTAPAQRLHEHHALVRESSGPRPAVSLLERLTDAVRAWRAALVGSKALSTKESSAMKTDTARIVERPV